MNADKVMDAMSREVITADPKETLSTALQLMLWTGARHLPVIDDGRLVGVLSERDILRYQGEHGGIAALGDPVDRAASKPTKFAHPEDSLLEAAARLAASKLGCLPVVVQGELVGILTTTDVLEHEVRRHLIGPGESPCAGEIMTTEPIVIHASDPLLTAVERMTEHGIRHLPVVDGDGRLCGILSDRDIRPITTRGELERTPVGSAMTPNAFTFGPDATRSMLVNAFTVGHLSAVPIVDEDQRPIGIVSYVDLVRELGA